MAYKRSDLMEQRIAANRDRILQATRKLVAVGGFREAQIAAVAADAGVSTGLIYRYFPSKAEMFVEVLTAAVDGEVAVLRGIAKGHEPVAERLGLAIDSFVRRALAGPWLAYAFIAEPVDPEVDAERIRGRRRFCEVFRDLLQEGIDSGEFAEQDADVTAACIVGAFTEALVGPIAPQLKKAQDPDRLMASIREVCLRAAGSTGVSTSRQGADAR